MSDDNPSIMSHVSVGTNHFERAAAFYDRVLSTLGAKRIVQHGDAISWGKQFPEFWLHVPIDGKPATIGNGTHIGFMAPSKEAVHAFYDAALKAGARDDGRPGPRAAYGEPYYGCFVRDLDDHKIEAAFWDLELAAKLGMG
jgi:catechol 2,3-dioxygenase-like lactoylglutathione lyase family enzyme